MSDTPLVSILITYYSLEHLFHEALDSARNQTYGNLEIVICDDCSPYTPAAELVARLNDSRISVVRHETNQGVGTARNTAARASRGRFMVPLDGDDKLHPTYVEKTLKAALESGAAAAYTDVQIFGTYSKVCTPSIDLGRILAGKYPFNTLLVSRELFEEVGGYDTFRCVQDTDFWISAIRTGRRFVHVPEPLYFYRRHGQSRTYRNANQVASDYYKVMLKHKDAVIENLDEILTHWSNDVEHPTHVANSLELEYKHLHCEFHKLLEQYNDLESRNQLNEKRLGSVRSLTKQLAYRLSQHIGLR